MVIFKQKRRHTSTAIIHPGYKSTTKPDKASYLDIKLLGTKVGPGEISSLVLTANQKVGIYFPGYSRVWPWVVLL